MSTDDIITLTPEGYTRIERELERLRTVERREVTDRIRDSQQSGEFAENAEYEDAKIEQAFVEGRIRDLRRILQHSQVLQPDDVPTDCVGLGSYVLLHDLEHRDTWEVRLVDSVESDPDHDRISDESPIGRALMGRKAGNEIIVAVPDGRLRYRIEGIRR